MRKLRQRMVELIQIRRADGGPFTPHHRKVKRTIDLRQIFLPQPAGLSLAESHPHHRLLVLDFVIEGNPIAVHHGGFGKRVQLGARVLLNDPGNVQL